MFLVWLQSRCSPQGHPPSTLLFFSSLFKQQIGSFHDSADRPGRGQGQTGFRLSGEAERRSLARRRGGEGGPGSVLYNGALVHSPQAAWRWQGFVAGRGRPRTPACQRRLLAPAKTAAPTTEMVIPAGFFKGEGALFSPPRFHRRPRVPAEPALAALGPGGSVGARWRGSPTGPI